MKAVFFAVGQIKDPSNLEEISNLLEVMTQIGMASGKECFANEYQFVLSALKSVMKDSANLQDEYDRLAVSITVLRAAANIASIMESDFVDLESFRELLLKAISAEPKLEKLTAETDDTEDDEYKIDVAGKVYRIDKMTLAFCTCGMKTAMSFARHLKHLFFPLLVPVLEAIYPAMDYKLMKDIQQIAIQAQPFFLQCATEMHKIESSENTKNFFATLLQK